MKPILSIPAPSLPSVKVQSGAAPPVICAPVSFRPGSESFELVLEYRRPAAAIIPSQISPDQRDTIYALLPSAAAMDIELARRWNVWAVLCTREWASEQKRRIPMFRPKTTTKLTFAQ
jgi:hypothetical protein